MRILLLDIETCPHIATVWKFFKENISTNQVLQHGEVICWAAKWLDSEEVIFDSVHQSSKRDMLLTVHGLLDEADAVVHYNGNRFDIPTLNQEMAIDGILPPAPFKNIDLIETVKKQFNFPTNRLDYVCQRLGIDGKLKHAGHELWLKCMAGDKESWKIMQEYNVHDVVIMEDLYLRLLPWIKGHPNRSTFDNDHVCPVCGSKKLQRRGTAMTSALTYQRWQCQSCGAWSRGRKCLPHEKSELVTSLS